jgi:hypothetical protein
MRFTARKTMATLAACVAVGAVAPSAASAGVISDAILYFRAQQNLAGGFSSAAGTFEEWAPSALAAVGQDASTFLQRDSLGNPVPGAQNLQKYLNGKWTDATWRAAPTGLVATEFERAILNAYAAGLDPARMAEPVTDNPQNMVAQLASTYSWTGTRNGRYGNGALNTNVFGLLALGGTPAPGSTRLRVPRALLDETADQLVADQHLDGGWDWIAGNPRARSDTDMTGATLAALCSVGYTTSDAVISNALRFLGTQQVRGGGFTAGFGVNTDSTGWAISGLNACGVDPTTWISGGADPLQFLASQQVTSVPRTDPDFGGFLYMPTQTVPNFYASIDSLRAYAGAGFTSAPPSWKPAPSIVSTTAPFALVIVDPSANTHFCRVEAALDASGQTTLGALLTAARTASLPASCVTSFTATGTSVSEVNGTTGSWSVSVDGATAGAAATTTVLGYGDTVTLTL